LFYEGAVKGKLEIDYECYSLLQVAKLNKVKATTLEDLFPKTKTIKKTEIPLRAVLKSGQKVFFFKEDMDELKELPKNELMKRLYKIVSFDENNCQMTFRYHIEARQDSKLMKPSKKDITKIIKDQGETKINFQNPHPKLKLSRENMNCAIENQDFITNPDGTIKWL
jgi:CRISPR-associated endonuclease Csn1